MSKVLVNETSLTSIADAIREKNGTTETYKPGEMGAAIAAIETGGGEDKVPNPLLYTGNCPNAFYYGFHDWLIENYFDRIKFEDVSDMYQTFASTKTRKIPSVKQGDSATDWTYTYYQAKMVEEIGDIENFNCKKTQYMFGFCERLRHAPNFVGTIQFSSNNAYDAFNGIFSQCKSLRSVPENFLSNIECYSTTSYYHYYSNMFSNCCVLDSINNLNVSKPNGALTTNVFDDTFYRCHRLKDLTFKTVNGKPYDASWKNQTIQLYNGVGWLTQQDSVITGYNSGITADKKVVGEATYEALKNDADWYSGMVEYSRFNHTSAVNLINSLPDTSAYIAENGGTNTVYLRNQAGEKTDGGKIGNLTEEEIAVAAAKGWTITYKT